MIKNQQRKQKDIASKIESIEEGKIQTDLMEMSRVEEKERQENQDCTEETD